MILLALLEVLFAVLKVLFSWLSLPDLPPEITSVIEEVMGYITDALPLLWVFFDKNVVTACLVIALACANFEKVYDLLMWILAKLPIGIKKN